MKKSVALIVVLAWVWLIGSFVEVVLKNTDKNPEYSSVNAFIIMKNIGGQFNEE